MSDGFGTTPEEITNAANQCTKTAGEVADQLAQLKSYVIGLESSWQGISQSTFQELMQEYQGYANMLVQSLNDISSGLHGNYVNYTQSEQATLNNIEQLQQELAASGWGNSAANAAADAGLQSSINGVVVPPTNA